MTAAIPGKASPTSDLTKEMLHFMKKGSVIADLAAERGGNVEGSVVNQKIYHDGDHHRICRPSLARVPVHASQLLTRNLTSFLKNMSKDGQLQVDLEDDIVSATHWSLIR